MTKGMQIPLRIHESAFLGSSRALNAEVASGISKGRGDEGTRGTVRPMTTDQ